MLNVFINPTFQDEDRGDGGIRRVCEAQLRYLPEFGVNVTPDPNTADVILNHGAMLTERPGVPMVSACHGLYWHDYTWDGWAYDTNARVTEAICRADTVVAVSQWVAHAIARGAWRKAEVVYHGVDTDIWTPIKAHKGYVLWNKARADAVSNPVDMQTLAALMSGTPFVTTIGEPTENVQVVGAQRYTQMRDLVQQAGVYLCTARETMGIGTLEALACGVPVVGWDYGGQSEIIKQGETGILVPYGDYQALAEAVRKVLKQRKTFSKAARADALARWQWRDKIEHLAYILQRTVDAYHRPGPRVSVIITTYNLAQYLPDALASVCDQYYSDWECLIVDDASTDNTPENVRPFLEDPRFRYLRLPENVGLSAARNAGFAQAKGRYILYLDADDMLEPTALADLSSALDTRSDISIAYGMLDVVNHAGKERRRNPWPAGIFDWTAQMAHLNQIPYCAMMRREVLQNTGGYRVRDWRAEDAAFWCRATSFGYRAENVTNHTVLIYRDRHDSKSKQEGAVHADKDGDWTAWYPWRLGASNGRDGLGLIKARVRPNASLVPFAAQGAPPAPLVSWPVRHHAHPAVSVVIPVGPGHAPHVVDALDSLIAQTLPDWEAVVVNDTGKALELPSFPWARVVNTAGGVGSGAARNAGIQATRAPLLLFLDADDVLRPDALEKLCAAYVAQRGGYVYSDYQVPQDPKRLDGPMDVFAMNDYDQRVFVASGYSQDRKMPGRHAVTALVAKEDAEAVGGFDETLPYWEDWEFYLKLAVAGVQGVRVPEPLLIYRTNTGQRREAGFWEEQHNADHTVRLVLEARYGPYARGEQDMCGCGKGAAGERHAPRIAAALMDMQPMELETPPDAFNVETAPEEVRLEYVGDRFGSTKFVGKVSRRPYWFGREETGRFNDVSKHDVPDLLSLGAFRVVDISRLTEARA